MPSLGLENSCCPAPPMAGQGPFWYQLGLLQCFLGLRRLHFYVTWFGGSIWGVLGHAGLSSRCSESTILLFLRSSNLDLFLDTFWTHVRFLFVAKRISEAHLGALAGSY